MEKGHYLYKDARFYCHVRPPGSLSYTSIFLVITRYNRTVKVANPATPLKGALGAAGAESAETQPLLLPWGSVEGGACCRRCGVDGLRHGVVFRLGTNRVAIGILTALQI